MSDSAAIVRDASPADYQAIDTINEAAFTGRSEADLVTALRRSGDVACELVAERNGDAVGHILLSRLAVPENCLALAPVSVAPSLQRKGIGSLLIRQAITRATSENRTAIFVLGEPAYYRRFGFCVKKAERFETDYPKAFFMVLELRPGALERLAGKIVYAAPFGNL